MPVTKIRKDQLRLTLQDIFDLDNSFATNKGVAVLQQPQFKVQASGNYLLINEAGIELNGGTKVAISGNSGSEFVVYYGGAWRNVPLVFQGDGISISNAGSVYTLTNTDKGTSQKIFKNIADRYGNVQFYANSNNDTLRFEALGDFLWIVFDNVNKKISYGVTINAGTGISITGNAISINLAAGTGIRIQGNTISVQYPTALLNEAQTWSSRQTFDAGIIITETGATVTNLGLKTVNISTFYEYNSPLRYGSLSSNGNQGFLFKFFNKNQILVFLNGQLLRGRTVGQYFSWDNEDYVWQYVSNRDAHMLCLREQIDPSKDIVTVFGLYRLLTYP